MIPIMNDYQRLQAQTQNIYIVIFGCWSLSQSLEVSFLELGVAENPIFAVGIVILTRHGSRDISISGFNGCNAISGCRTSSQSPGTLYSDSPWSEIPDLPLEF